MGVYTFPKPQDARQRRELYPPPLPSGGSRSTVKVRLSILFSSLGTHCDVLLTHLTLLNAPEDAWIALYTLIGILVNV